MSTYAFGSTLRTGEKRSSSPTKTQLWKTNDDKADKSGSCHSVYWAKEKKNEAELKSFHLENKTWQTGNVYKGEWTANKKQGYGVQVWSNGNKYEGEWVHGKREGHGIFWVKQGKKTSTSLCWQLEK